jgi:hypothetical protein
MDAIDTIDIEAVTAASMPKPPSPPERESSSDRDGSSSPVFMAVSDAVEAAVDDLASKLHAVGPDVNKQKAAAAAVVDPIEAASPPPPSEPNAAEKAGITIAEKIQAVLHTAEQETAPHTAAEAVGLGTLDPDPDLEAALDPAKSNSSGGGGDGPTDHTKDSLLGRAADTVAHAAADAVTKAEDSLLAAAKAVSDNIDGARAVTRERSYELADAATQAVHRQAAAADQMAGDSLEATSDALHEAAERAHAAAKAHTAAASTDDNS